MKLRETKTITWKNSRQHHNGGLGQLPLLPKSSRGHVEGKYSRSSRKERGARERADPQLKLL